MCGISGLIGISDKTLGEKMAQAIRHRGPDDWGVWSSPHGTPVTLVNTRLAIIDLSPAGHMPMPSPDGNFIIAYNGEVYNFADIRRTLEAAGHRFLSHSDTEVILHAYMEWGSACVNHLRGMFAFLIWDMPAQRLFAARDRLGKKPLYFAETPQGVVFSSELKGILASGWVQPRLNHTALHHYLTFWSVPFPHTLLAGVQQLLPGHTLTWQNGQIHTHCYWDLPVHQPTRLALPEIQSELRRLLEESIRLRMIADVPVGAFLSGGIDSGAVVGLMAKQSGSRLKTFSVGFGSEGTGIDERSIARITAERFNTDHTEVQVDGAQVLSALPEYIRGMDQPTGDGLNTWLVSRSAAQQVKVTLSGLGGDELFAGYPQFRSLQQAEIWHQRLKPAESVLRPLLGAASGVAASVLNRASLRRVPDFLLGDFLGRYTSTRTLFTEPAKQALYAQASTFPDSRTCLAEFDWAMEQDIVAKVSRMELKGYMAHTLLRDSDAMSMAHSLEVRVPFIDHPLLEFVHNIPGELRLQGRTPKALLTSVLRDILPIEVIEKRKQGFEMPVASWLRNELRPVAEATLHPNTVRQRGLFNPQAVQNLWQNFLAGRGLYMHVWVLIVLELWLAEFGVEG
ncbi:MAG TPA: asparagine synthase (glutamine-hydrolyzing) [Anaerolineales bacterium]|nr:asparagine synthase (glutamine-hydrolyzing) [Anaerolineales bacterium]